MTNPTMSPEERAAELTVSDIETKADFVEYRLVAFEREQGKEYTDAERHDLAHEIRRVLGWPFNAWIARKTAQAERAALERAARMIETQDQWVGLVELANKVRALAEQPEEVG